jgi:phospholipid-binding lipoprotein MlaA
MRRPNLVRSLLILGPSAAVLAAGTPCAAAAAEPSDPFEGMNRRFFAIETVLDRAVIGPVAYLISKTPKPIGKALRNFGRNLGEPVVAVNDVLQGHVGTAASTVGRFAINSIFGIAGLADPAKAGGIPHHDNDFGTTLGRWGVGPGPYLFLPLLGPSTLRDSVGDLGDIGLNPLTYVHYREKVVVGVTTSVIDGLGARADAEQDLATIFATSVDPYATLRSYYLQNRQAQITGKTEIGPLPEFDDTAPPSATPPDATTGPQPEAPAPTTSAAPETAAPPQTPSGTTPPDRQPRASACQPQP